jgi:hypothetical protein
LREGGTIATRIDFDCAFSQDYNSIDSVIESSAIDKIKFPYFIPTLSKQSFADELRRLASISIESDPGMKKLSETVSASLRAHGYFINIRVFGNMFNNVKTVLTRNGKVMSLIAEIVSINVILSKKESEISLKDQRLISDAFNRIKESMIGHTSIDDLKTAATIFGLAAYNCSSIAATKYQKTLEMAREHDPLIFTELQNGFNRGAILTLAQNPNKANYCKAFASLTEENKVFFDKFVNGRLGVPAVGIAPLLVWRTLFSMPHADLDLSMPADPGEFLDLEDLTPFAGAGRATPGSTLAGRSRSVPGDPLDLENLVPFAGAGRATFDSTLGFSVPAP